MNRYTSGKGGPGLGVLIMGPTHELTDHLYRELVARRDLEVYKVVDEYPSLHHLVRLLNSYEPDLVFLEMGSSESAMQVARDVLAASQSTAVIGFAREVNPDKRFEATGIGVVEILRLPLSEESLKRAIGRTLESKKLRRHENVIAFLPAKAGSGATTTALNVAGSLVRDCKKSVLIIEADLHSGLLPILLNLDPQQSIVNALEISSSLNDSNWGGLISKAHGLDLLPTPFGKAPTTFTPWEYHRLLAFVSPRYDHVIVDLPEVVNDATEAIVARATSINIICTAENSSVFLARRRIHELGARSVKPDRVQVLLNRHGDEDRLEEVEVLLGRRLSFVLPNDYVQVREATVNSGLVEPASDLGRAYKALAYRLAGIEEPAASAASPKPSAEDTDPLETDGVDAEEGGGLFGMLRRPLAKLRR